MGPLELAGKSSYREGVKLLQRLKPNSILRQKEPRAANAETAVETVRPFAPTAPSPTPKAQSAWEAAAKAPVLAPGAPTVDPKLVGRAVDLAERYAASMAATTKAQTQLARVTAQPPSVDPSFPLDPVALVTAATDDVGAAERAQQSIKKEFLALRQEVSEAMKHLPERKARLAEALSQIKEKAPFRPPDEIRQTTLELGRAYAHADSDLNRAYKAWATLDAVPVPGGWLNNTTVAVGASVTAGLPGVANVYANGTLRLDAATHERKARLLPVGSVGMGASMVGATSYVIAPKDSGYGGWSKSLSLMTPVCFGTGPQGAFVGVSMQGLFGLSLIESGEIGGYFALPTGVLPIPTPNVNWRVGHRSMRAFTEPLIEGITRGAIAVGETAVKTHDWLARRIDNPKP
jgi:hypothetical protein